MITRSPQVALIPTFLVPSITHPLRQTSTRFLHSRNTLAPPPLPTPFVPDPQTFLTLIGRKLSAHSSKITTWDSLFSLTSRQLKDLGVEPPRSRRYLLWWRDRFRRGEHGPGGDLQHVEDGVAELRVVEQEPTSTSLGGMHDANAVATALLTGSNKMVVNVKAGTKVGEALPASDLRRVTGFRVRGAQTIVGPYVEYVKGTNGSIAKLKVQEGMWEERRGHKVDGGERRKEFNRAMRRLKEKGTLKA